MASAGKERKGDFSLPDWMAKSLECPVCLETIKDPPIFQGHALCSTCREPLKAQDKPCPVCRGKLLDVRNLAVEKMLEQLPRSEIPERITDKQTTGDTLKTEEVKKQTTGPENQLDSPDSFLPAPDSFHLADEMAPDETHLEL